MHDTIHETIHRCMHHPITWTVATYLVVFTRSFSHRVIVEKARSITYFYQSMIIRKIICWMLLLILLIWPWQIINALAPISRCYYVVCIQSTKAELFPFEFIHSVLFSSIGYLIKLITAKMVVYAQRMCSISLVQWKMISLDQWISTYAH